MKSLAVPFYFASLTLASACVPNYIPIQGDNTAALTLALAAGPVCLPAGTISISSSVGIPSNSVLDGQRGLSTIQKTSASLAGQSMFINANAQPISNIQISNITFDGNASNNSSAPFFVIGLSEVTNITIHDISIINPYGTTLWINGPDPGIPPNGAQINSNVNVYDSYFNGSNAIATNGDMVVIGRTDGVLFQNNRLVGAGANMLALQFLLHWNVAYNHLSDFWRGIYIETSQFGSVHDNDLETLGTPSPTIGDARATGIWATSANESYGSSAGFNGSQWIDITHNRISNLQRSTGSSGIGAIVISAPGGLPAINNRIERNIIAGGLTQVNNAYAIIVEGQHDGSTVDGNSIWAFNGAIVGTGTYNGASLMLDVGVKDNVAESCNVFGFSGSGIQHTNYSLLGNRMSNNTSPGGWSGATPTGFLRATNQGF